MNTFLHNSNSDFSWFDNNVRWVLDITNVRAVVPELHVWYCDRSIFLVKISSPSDPVFKWYVFSRVWLPIRVIEKLQSRKRGYKNNPISKYGATVLLPLFQHSPRASCVTKPQPAAEVFLLLPHHFCGLLSLPRCFLITYPRLYLNHPRTRDCKFQFSVGFDLFCGWIGWGFFLFCRGQSFADKEVGERKKPGNLIIIKGQNTPGTQPSVFQAQEAACILAEKGYQVSHLVFCCVLLATKAQLN